MLTHIRAAADAMLSAGVSCERLEELMQPPFWQLRQGDPLPLQQALQHVPLQAGIREVPAHLQAKLSHQIHEQAKRQFWISIQPPQGAQDQQLNEHAVACARWLSQSGKGAMAFCSVIPSTDPSFTLSNDVCKESLRRALGEERPGPGGICGNSSCTHPATAAHSRSCTYGGECTTRHNECVRATHKGMQTEAGITGLQLEYATPFLQHIGQPLRTDIAVPPDYLNTAAPGQQSNIALGQLIDHVHPDPTAASYRERASREAGYAARSNAEGKHNKYRGKFATDQYTLIPFAVEQFGAACDEAHRLLQALALRQSQRSGGIWRKSQCIARWRQRVSIALQRAVSESVARTLARCTQPLAEGGSHTGSVPQLQ